MKIHTGYIEFNGIAYISKDQRIFDTLSFVCENLHAFKENCKSGCYSKTMSCK